MRRTVAHDIDTCQQPSDGLLSALHKGKNRMIREADVLAALPPSGFIRSYVEYASSMTDANCAYHVAGALTCLSQCVPLDFSVPYASPIWGNIYSMIVGDSSKSRKTAAINIAQRVIREAIPGAVGEVPGSQEGLYESLRAQQRQLIIYGEWGEFLAKAEEGYLMSLKTSYTNLWDGIPIGRALANSRKGAVTDPRLSLLCGVATDLLERHTEQADWTGGFLARFFTLYGEPEREFATPPIDDPARRQNIVQWLTTLATPANPPGTCLWLDAAGQKMWTDWYAGMKPMREGANRRAAAACARSTSIAAKLALLIAWDVGQARSGYDWYVGPTELESALKLTDLHLHSVLELGERVTGNRDMRDRASVLRAIADSPTPLGFIIKESELLKRRVKEIIDSLMEERTIGQSKIGNETCYHKTPHAHALLAQMARPGAAVASAPGIVLPMRPPAPQAALIPAADVLDQIDPSEEDDIDWSRYEG